MLSRSPLLKASSFVMQNDDAIVIHSNERMAAKIEEIAHSLEQVEQEGFGDSFSEGIEAAQVATLLSEDNGDSMVQPAGEQVYDGPSPEELIGQAEYEIQEMKERAEAEIAENRSRAMREATEEGHRQGYDQGYQEGLRQAALENDARKRELDERAHALQEEYERRLSEVEPTLIDTLTDIYAHIFDVDMSDYRNVIMHLIETTLHRVDGCDSYLVRVSKEDYPYVSMQKQSVLGKCVTSSARLEVVEDVTLTANECLIETDSGIYDCSVGTELKELKKQLMLLSYQDRK